MYKIIDNNGNTLQEYFATKGEAQAFAKCIKGKTKVVSNTKYQLIAALEQRQELPTDNKGNYIDEQRASASYILCNTLALNLVREVLQSKAQIKSSCLSAGFAVKCKGSVMDLQDAVYAALQSAGINCYCGGTSIIIDWVAIDVQPGFVSVQCTLDEYERCMRWLGVHERL